MKVEQLFVCANAASVESRKYSVLFVSMNAILMCDMNEYSGGSVISKNLY